MSGEIYDIKQFLGEKMVSLKKINLDQNKMENDLEKNAKSFFGDTATVNIRDLGNSKNFEITINSIVYKICVYYKKDGTTSLCSAGTPDTHDMTDAFIHKISQDYCISDKKSVSFSIQNIDDSTFKVLREYFINDLKVSISAEKKDDFYDMIQFKGTTGDMLTIKRYSNGNTQFQGKPLVLYTHLCEFLSEFCSAKDIIDAQQKIYDVKINKDEIEREFNARFITSKDFFEEELKSIILPAFSLKNIQIDLSDYSLFVFPILKGLEGYIRAVFKYFNITTDSKRNSIGSFFTQNMNKFELNVDTRNVIKDISVQKALGELYTLYSEERNSIFHVDGGIINTRIIETRDEADSIFEKTVNLIESTYIDMKL